jgi:hypothetical protein
MNKKNKTVLIRRKIREVIELRQTERIVLFCESCQNEQSFRLKESAVQKSFIKENEPQDTKNIFINKEE